MFLNDALLIQLTQLISPPSSSWQMPYFQPEDQGCISQTGRLRIFIQQCDEEDNIYVYYTSQALIYKNA